jgi:hypothetical protein
VLSIKGIGIIVGVVALITAVPQVSQSAGIVYTSSDLSDVPTIGDLLDENPEDISDIPFTPACGDLVKFYRTLDSIIPTKSLPQDQQDEIEKMEKGIARYMACEEYFKGLKFELWSAK